MILFCLAPYTDRFKIICNFKHVKALIKKCRYACLILMSIARLRWQIINEMLMFREAQAP